MAEVLDLFMLEQFLEDLEEGTQCLVRRHQPQGMEEALTLAEAFTAAEKVGTWGKGHKIAGPLVCAEATSKKTEEAKTSN